MIIEQTKNNNLRVISSEKIVKSNLVKVVNLSYNKINTLVPNFKYNNKKNQEIVYKGGGLSW